MERLVSLCQSTPFHQGTEQSLFRLRQDDRGPQPRHQGLQWQDCIGSWGQERQAQGDQNEGDRERDPEGSTSGNASSQCRVGTTSERSEGPERDVNNVEMLPERHEKESIQQNLKGIGSS